MLRLNQPQPRLMNKRSGLQGVSSCFICHANDGKIAEFIINQGQQLTSSFGIALLGSGKNDCYVTHDVPILSKTGHQCEAVTGQPNSSCLGKITSETFAQFIGKQMRLSKVEYAPRADSGPIFNFYMGKNTPERKDYIMDKLVVPVED